ncbi:MAG: hypothetical protein LRZ85_03290 [Alphaproteobacteria bacterium]|nr:hypothetical protein [Alphaproteobacteria bacterium]
MDLSTDPFFSWYAETSAGKSSACCRYKNAPQAGALENARSIEHTSLTGAETKQEIEALCREAIGNGNNSAAAVCIFGERVLPGGLAVAKKNLVR